MSNEVDEVDLGDVSRSPKEQEAPRATGNRSTVPQESAFNTYVQTGWADRDESLPEPREVAAFAKVRREALAAEFAGRTLAIGAGNPKVRSNDTDYPFRAHTAFAYLTGWGADTVPGSVLLLTPSGDGHEATLFFRERAGRDTREFYANPEIGEFWTGPRPSSEQVAAELGIPTRSLDELPSVLHGVDDLLVAGELTLDADGPQPNTDGSADLERAIGELRLVKDAYEIAQMSEAVDATAEGFRQLIEALPAAQAAERGERVLEGTFDRHARVVGNTVGYGSIVAAGDHACYLHWTNNHGAVRDGDLVLVDAGVELDSLYTADITRTLPVNGTFRPEQRQVYEAVLEAADAAIAVIRPGIRFREVHEAAMQVIARKVTEWGFLPVSLEETLAPEGQQHRRFMVHGTSHHLGIDVHDCATARREMYMDGIVKEGMCFTVEPGLYFQADDLTVPEAFRGIGVRIEDDVIVTADGVDVLSANIPRTADAVEAWMREVRG